MVALHNRRRGSAVGPLAHSDHHDDGAKEHSLEIRDVDHWFIADGRPPIEALVDISLSVPAGGFTALVGPSGCGKTTLLNMLAGLISPTHGEIRIGRRRPAVGMTEVGYLFARDTLFPWRTARDNVALALELSHFPRKARRERADEVLAQVGLEGFGSVYPAQLSQGMRQRVALARTLVVEPRVILMDEPFAALDAQTRVEMQGELLRLWEAHRATVLFITHDLAESVTLADEVIVLSPRPGRIRRRFTIDLERPRSVAALQQSEEYHNTLRAIWAEVGADFLEGMPERAS